MNINLLPWRENQWCHECYRWLLIFLIMSGGLLIVFCNAYYLLSTKTYRVSFELTELKNKIRNAHAHRPISISNTQLLSKIFAITRTLPNAVYLTQLHYRKGWRLHGCATETAMINQFISRLKTIHQFRQIRLNHLHKQKNYFVFSITLQ